MCDAARAIYTTYAETIRRGRIVCTPSRFVVLGEPNRFTRYCRLSCSWEARVAVDGKVQRCGAELPLVTTFRMKVAPIPEWLRGIHSSPARARARENASGFIEVGSGHAVLEVLVTELH